MTHSDRGHGAPPDDDAPQPAPGPPATYYECPECSVIIQAGSVAHQHGNGEWVYTDDIRRFLQAERWRELLARRARP